MDDTILIMGSLPSIEAGPGPLPTAGPFLRVMSGQEAADTVMMRATVQLVAVWREHFETCEPGAPMSRGLKGRLSVNIWAIDREVKGTLSAGPHALADVAENAATFGEGAAATAGQVDPVKA